MSLKWNLDWEAQQGAQAIVGEAGSDALENRLRAALAVLQEQGIYAMLLYLYGKDRNPGAGNRIAWPLIGLAGKITPLPQQFQDNPPKPAEILQYVSANITNDLNTMLLVKQLWEQTLIYARYSCKLDG